VVEVQTGCFLAPVKRPRLTQATSRRDADSRASAASLLGTTRDGVADEPSVAFARRPGLFLASQVGDLGLGYTFRLMAASGCVFGGHPVVSCVGRTVGRSGAQNGNRSAAGGARTIGTNGKHLVRFEFGDPEPGDEVLWREGGTALHVPRSVNEGFAGFVVKRVEGPEGTGIVLAPPAAERFPF